MHQIYYKKDSAIWLTNGSFGDLVDQLLARAEADDLTKDQFEDVQRLRKSDKDGELWAGRCLEMSKDLMALRFPEFWSRQLYGLASDISRGHSEADFGDGRSLTLIFGSDAWSYFFGLRAREEEQTS